MIWDQQKGHFVFKTGRTLPANMGSLGVDKHGRLTSGYDLHPFEDATTDDPDDYVKPFTLQERAEIAEYMREQWARWVTDTAAVVESARPASGGTYRYNVVACKLAKHDFAPYPNDKTNEGVCSFPHCSRWRDDDIHFQE